jgi:mono/diheme cytochrome c family protein
VEDCDGWTIDGNPGGNRSFRLQPALGPGRSGTGRHHAGQPRDHLTPAEHVAGPPGGAAQQPGAKGNTGPQVNQLEYEGWRQYSVQCARCHGQDVLPNPVAANLLTSLAAGGPIDTPEKFTQVVTAGRPHRGMPSFKSTMTPAQIQAVYAYVKGRADKRISPGRPQQPSG